MSYEPNQLSTARRYLSASLGALFIATLASAADAQVCLQTPNVTPDVAGMPRWPAPGETYPQVTVPQTIPLPPRDQRLAGEVSDPRWSGGPLREMSADLNSLVDTARYRMIVDSTSNPTQIAVSIQLRAKNGAPGGDDFAYFGIATDPPQVTPGTPVAAVNFKAWGIRVALSAPSTGTEYQAVNPGNVASYGWDSGQWTAANGSIPSWIVPNTLALWYLNDPNDAALNGAALALQFKVDVSSGPLSILANNAARIMLGTQVALTSTTFAQFSEPSLAKCGAGGCGYPAAVLGVPAIPFFADMNNWTQVSPIGAGATCAGISIRAQDITATNSAITNLATDVTDAALVTTLCNGRSNCLSAHAAQINRFKATPTVPPEWETSGTVLNTNDVRTTFKLSNWGTVANPTEWRPLGTVGNISEDASLTPYTDPNNLDAHPITLTCPTNTGDGYVCAQPITVDYNTAGFHQCLLAELEAGSLASQAITFANAAAYINTRFEKASVIDDLAEINVRGLVDLDPSKPNRDVYLHVVRTNMTAAGPTKTSLDMPALEATRRQADRDFSDQRNGCSNANDQCMPLDGASAAGCVSPCDGPNGTQCAAGRSAYQLGYAGCWCVPTVTSTIEWCSYIPASNGSKLNLGKYNPDVRALDGAQVLNATYPTFEIFPYYDSGKTVVVNGQSKKKLVALPTFGIHAWHEGDFYGWLSDLVDESGGKLDKVDADVYKISVSKATGVARIRVLLSAEEQPHYAPFTEIVGTATPLSLGLGNVTLTGISNTASPIDLSKATMTLTNLLLEGAVERVTNLGGPVTLTRQGGATPSFATFKSSGWGKPTIVVTVANLPLIGQTIQITVTGANVQKPAGCGLFFGSSNLSTQFSLSDGTNAPIAFRGTDQWTCVPFQLLNL